MPTLVALAGVSRSGKGTAAEVFHELARDADYTSLERQLSGPGKHHLARIFRPDFSEAQAIAWFENLKMLDKPMVEITSVDDTKHDLRSCTCRVLLREFIQHGLQEGARDIWGDDFWTDMLLPEGTIGMRDGFPMKRWYKSFEMDDGHVSELCLISDLRQANEAKRVRDLGGVVVELRRDGDGVGSDHVTDKRLPYKLVDIVINNDTNLHDLKVGAAQCFKADVLPLLKGA